jgi:hypothetical protein
MLTIAKHSFGMGDRFAHQGHAQLSAITKARAAGIDICPVWNKSNREHLLVGTRPDDLRAEADAAVRAAGWTGAYHVDADHIGLATVDGFLAASDFFTIDVADFTGRPASEDELAGLVRDMARHGGKAHIPGLDAPLPLDAATVRAAGAKFLLAVREAGRIYRHIADRKGAGTFITEVSVDETDAPQSPAELLLILAMLAREGVPVQTIAPKFTGRFNKGVDYVGDLARFATEFEEDLLVLAYAKTEFGLPASLKLSVHSGSDKFSLYPIINRLLKRHDAGLHLKTAGTTWLEEVIGLAEAGGDGLAIANEIYAAAHPRAAELIAPYAPVVDIEVATLPAPAEVAAWSAGEFAATLRHDPANPRYSPPFRQFVHVSFKVAAELGDRFTAALERHEAGIARNVTDNLLTRHILPLFG